MAHTNTYYIVYQHQDNEKRRVYTFDNEMSAHDMVEFIYKNDSMPTSLTVEPHEVTA